MKPNSSPMYLWSTRSSVPLERASMRCGLVAFARCAALRGPMRGPMRCGLVTFAQCALVAVASAGGTMLLTEGFLGVGGDHVLN